MQESLQIDAYLT
jgi:hypothetical protein